MKKKKKKKKKTEQAFACTGHKDRFFDFNISDQSKLNFRKLKKN